MGFDVADEPGERPLAGAPGRSRRRGTRRSCAEEWRGSQTVREVPEEAVLTVRGRASPRQVAANEAAHEHPAAASEWSAESPVGTDLVRRGVGRALGSYGANILALRERRFFPADEATTDETTDTMTGEGAGHPESLRQRLADLSVTLRLHRSDLYLGARSCWRCWRFCGRR